MSKRQCELGLTAQLADRVAITIMMIDDSRSTVYINKSTQTECEQEKEKEKQKYK